MQGYHLRCEARSCVLQDTPVRKTNTVDSLPASQLALLRKAHCDTGFAGDAP